MGEQPSKEALLKEARQYCDDGRLDKAIGVYQKLAAMDPNDSRLLLRMAELHVKSKQVPQAVKLYQDVAAKYLDDGFYLKCVTIYKTILRINPALHDVNVLLAELYEKMGLDQDAIVQYQIMLRFYEQKGMSDKAMELRRRIVALDPDNVKHRVRLAESYQLQGNDEASLHEYEVLADKLQDVGTDDQLVDLYEKILSKRPSHIDLLKRLCRILDRQGDARKVLHWMTTCASIVAEDPEMMRLQATLFGRLNQMESARTKWKELAELWLSRGDQDEALKAYEEIMVVAPDEAADIEEEVDRVQAGAFAALQQRADVRIAQLVDEEREREVLEEAQTEAADHIRQQEEKATARATRRAPEPAVESLKPDEYAAARHSADASVNLGDAYMQMGMQGEAAIEYTKALEWNRRLLVSGAGAQDLVSEVKRLESLVSGEQATAEPSESVEATEPPKAATPPSTPEPESAPEPKPKPDPAKKEKKKSTSKKRVSYV